MELLGYIGATRKSRMLFSLPRTYPLRSPSPELGAVLRALGHQGKNVRNSLVFHVRNVLTSFEGGSLKPVLHENQARSLAFVDKVIEAVNAKRTARVKAQNEANKATSSKPVKAPTLIKSVNESPWAILNVTVMDNVARTNDYDNTNPYRSVPVAVAQSVVQQVLSDFRAYHKAVKEYAANPGRFTGRPQMPGYDSRDGVASFDIPLSRTTGKALPAIKGKDIAIDYDCSAFLTPEQKEAWDRYDLGGELKALAAKAPLPPKSIPRVLRISFGKGTPSASVVFESQIEIPDDWAMSIVWKQALAQSGTRKTKHGADKPKTPKPELITRIAQALAPEQVGAIAGMDTGNTNLASISFSNNKEGMVVSSGRILKGLVARDKRLDALKSTLTTPEHRELQSRADQAHSAKTKLPQADYIRLGKLQKALYSDASYRKLVGRRDRWLNDALKKVAAGILRKLCENDIRVFVAGQNKLWKQECNLGAATNRKFLALAHGRLLGMVKAACERHGILFLATEESFTSKTSFVNNVPLRKYEDLKSKNGNPAEELALTKSPKIGQEKQGYGGKRLAARNVYRNDRIEPLPQGWVHRVHADLNGAFNILRKMFAWFKFSEDTRFEYSLYWLSPQRGLAAFSI